MGRTYRSTIIAAPVDRVWGLIRDFDALPAWHPLIAASEIEYASPGDRVGAVRRFRLHDGGVLREQLLSLDDAGYSFTYNILMSPMAVANYVASIRLVPLSEQPGTFIEWWAEFDVTDGREQYWLDDIGDNVFVAGFENLNALLADSTEASDASGGTSS